MQMSHDPNETDLKPMEKLTHRMQTINENDEYGGNMLASDSNYVKSPFGDNKKPEVSANRANEINEFDDFTFKLNKVKATADETDELISKIEEERQAKVPLSTLDRIYLTLNNNKNDSNHLPASEGEPSSTINSIINEHIIKSVFQTDSDSLNLFVSCSICHKNLNDTFWFICLKCDNTIYCVDCEEDEEDSHDEEHILLKVNGKEKNDEKPNAENKSGEIVYTNRYSAKINPSKGISRTVTSSKQFSVDITVENNGTQEWPQETELCCLDGFCNNFHEGIPSLKSKSNHSFSLRLTAPSNPGVYKTKWRLGYRLNNETKFFGEYLPIDILVDNSKDTSLNKSGLSFNEFNLNNPDETNRKSSTSNSQKRK